MQAFKLPEIHSDPIILENIIYFSCDINYYNKYGMPLIKSIVYQNNWVGVHCHIICKDDISFKRIDNPQVTYSYELITDEFIQTINFKPMTIKLNKFDVDLDAEKTYYACARFMQADKIFSTNDKRIFQIDCDSLMFKPFSSKDFNEVTSHVRAMRKPKTPEKIIASALSYGNGDVGLEFRKLLASKLYNAFSNEAYWFIDQIIMQELFSNMEFISIPLHWNHWSFKKPFAYFRTGKGNKKSNNDIFLKELERWTNL
jgi:hypothetical protein